MWAINPSIGSEEDCALDGGGESGHCNVAEMWWAEGYNGVDVDKEDVLDEADETITVLDWDELDKSVPQLQCK